MVLGLLADPDLPTERPELRCMGTFRRLQEAGWDRCQTPMRDSGLPP